MDAQGLTSPQRKLVMWYKVTELKSKGLHCVQIAHELGLHRHTVEKYVKMTLEEFQASQVHDHLREHHADFPEVSEKTVFNLVMRVRDHRSLVVSL